MHREKKTYNVNLAAKIAQGPHEYHQMQITPRWKVE